MKLRPLFFSIFLFFSTISAAAQDPTEEEWDWVNGNFPAVYDEVFGLGASPDNVIFYRSCRDLYRNEFEHSFWFRKTGNKTFEFVYREPVEKSIYDQIMQRHRSNKTIQIESIIPNLRYKDSAYKSEKCPAVQRQLNQFFDKTLPIFLRKERASMYKNFREGTAEIVLHPRLHEVTMILTDAKLELSTVFDDNALAKWASLSIATIRKCQPSEQLPNSRTNLLTSDTVSK